jgi:hypothetical protein
VLAAYRPLTGAARLRASSAGACELSVDFAAPHMNALLPRVSLDIADVVQPHVPRAHCEVL